MVKKSSDGFDNTMQCVQLILKFWYVYVPLSGFVYLVCQAYVPELVFISGSIFWCFMLVAFYKVGRMLTKIADVYEPPLS